MSSRSRRKPAASSPTIGRAKSTPRAAAAPADRDEQGEDRAGEPAGLLALAGGQQPGVDRDERRRERLLAEQVLQQIRQRAARR